MRLLESPVVVVVKRGICRYLFSVVVEVTKVRVVVRKKASVKVFRSSKDKVVVSLKISLQSPRGSLTRRYQFSTIDPRSGGLS